MYPRDLDYRDMIFRTLDSKGFGDLHPRDDIGSKCQHAGQEVSRENTSHCIGTGIIKSVDPVGLARE